MSDAEERDSELAAVSAPLVSNNDLASKQQHGALIPDNQRTEEKVVQDALNETGFGKFNFRVLTVTSLVFMNMGFGLSSIGLILPAAGCDFRMTNADKGRLTASPMLGMLCGSYFWGCYADLKGRKVALLTAIFLHATAEFAASLTPYYWGFLFLKFISGMAMNGQMILVFTYLGEFQPTKYRDRFLAWLEIPWALGLIILPGVAWVIIPLSISYEYSSFFFHSWNFFVMICSFPGMIIGIWLIFFPETPKWLAKTGRDSQMLDVLANMFAENTGKPPKDYIARLKNSGNDALGDLVIRVMHMKDRGQKKNDEAMREEAEGGKSVLSVMKNILAQTTLIVKAPYLKRTIVICFIWYSIISSYYTLTLWLPDLFFNFEKFEETFPNRSASVCTVMEAKNLTREEEVTLDTYGCATPIKPRVYIYTILLGVSCIPTGIALPVLVDRFGYKFFLIFTTIASSIVTVGLFWVRTSVENLVLSCIFESLTSISINVVYCLQVELYPTNFRATAAGLSAFFGRLGAIIGNWTFGYLIDKYCVPLILIVALQLLMCGIFGIFVSAGKKRKRIPKTQTEEQKNLS